MNRRDFLRGAAATLGAAATGVPSSLLAQNAPAARPAALPEPTVAKLPRWRGFNLLEWFFARGHRPFREKDFELIAELGFDFVRLPLAYDCWNSGKIEDWDKINEKELEQVDKAVEYGRQHGIHVCVNFHRAPGYCINPPPEPVSLWDDEFAQETFAKHWAHFAGRYKGRPNREVSFDLVNEPPYISEDVYAGVMKRAIAAIHEVDPQRLIICDGIKVGTAPTMQLAGVVAQSTRGYDPSRVSHFKANWVQGSDQWPAPTWPLKYTQGEGDKAREQVWDQARLKRERIEPWKALEAKGSGVHVGEWGCYNRTPHDVALAWMKDYLELWKEAGWGWALWNFRGDFGPLDSKRQDVQYEDWKGHKLDRKMLELIKAY
jgi:endoglucanase